jgi:hypothetical protein
MHKGKREGVRRYEIKFPRTIIKNNFMPQNNSIKV